MTTLKAGPIVGRKTIATLWAKTEGKAWEPRDPNNPLVQRLIEQGFVRRVDGRCGFERLKDAMLAWTEAGAAAGRAAVGSDTAGGTS